MAPFSTTYVIYNGKMTSPEFTILDAYVVKKGGMFNFVAIYFIYIAVIRVESLPKMAS